MRQKKIEGGKCQGITTLWTHLARLATFIQGTPSQVEGGNVR